MSPSFDGSDIDESSIVFYRIGVDNWAAMGCNSAGIPIMAYGTNQSDKTVYQFNRDGITINNEIKLVTNADLETPFIKLGSDNNKWGGFDIVISDNEYIRFQANSSGRIELVRYVDGSLTSTKILSAAGWGE